MLSKSALAKAKRAVRRGLDFPTAFAFYHSAGEATGVKWVSEAGVSLREPSKVAVVEARVWEPFADHADGTREWLSTGVSGRLAAASGPERSRKEQWGHATCRLMIDLTDDAVPESDDLLGLVFALLERDDVEVAGIPEAVDVNMSLFPVFKDKSGESLRESEQERLEALFLEDDSVDLQDRRALQFAKRRSDGLLGRAYPAKIELDPAEDIRKYGKPRIMLPLRAMDMPAVLNAYGEFFKVGLSKDRQVFVGTQVQPTARYFGRDLLRQLAKLSGMASSVPEPKGPEAVCTTAVLQILTAGYGMDTLAACYAQARIEHEELPRLPLTTQLAAIVGKLQDIELAAAMAVTGTKVIEDEGPTPGND